MSLLVNLVIISIIIIMVIINIINIFFDTKVTRLGIIDVVSKR